MISSTPSAFLRSPLPISRFGNNFEGNTIYIGKSIDDLSALPRFGGNWGNYVSFVKFNSGDFPELSNVYNNFKGVYLQFFAEDFTYGSIFAKNGWNDAIKSIQVPKGFTVTVWEHDFGGGNSATFDSDQT
jgi:hypothetical protein